MCLVFESSFFKAKSEKKRKKIDWCNFSSSFHPIIEKGTVKKGEVKSEESSSKKKGQDYQFFCLFLCM